MVGKYENYLYAAFKVTDSSLVYRAKNVLSFTRNDPYRSCKTPEGEFKSYVVAARQDGWVNAFDATTQQPVTKIQGYLKAPTRVTT